MIFWKLNWKKNVAVFCIAEHWLNSNEINLVSLQNYKIAAHFCRKSKIHGGTVIFVKKNYVCSSLAVVNNLALEEIFELSSCFIKELNILIICFYRTPDINNRLKFLELLNRLFYIVFPMNVEVIITGDFNIDFNSNNETILKLSSLADSYGFNIMFKDVVTRPGIKYLGTCIDNILTTVHPS